MILTRSELQRRWLLLPVPAFVAWLAIVEHQCLTQWVSFNPDGMALGETARCFATLVLTGLPPSLALLVMLRYVAPLRPTAVVLTGSLAVAAITATALSLFHALDASVMILLWNFRAAVVTIGFGGMLSRTMSRE